MARLEGQLYPVIILAWLADWFGLATIIGAFAAGIIIEEDYFPGGVKAGR